MPAVLMMAGEISRDDARVLFAAYLRAVNLDHDPQDEYRRNGACYITRCAECGLAIVAVPSERRVSGRATRERCSALPGGSR